jgi:Mg2+-importing ATPase
VAQSALTGEGLPAEKSCAPVAATLGSPLELPNIGFLGTNVTSGTATALVVNTGESTYLGSVAESLVGQRALTSFEIGIRGVSLLLLRFMAVMTVIVFFINGFTKHDWKEAFFFALAVAVGLTPEMLPMIVSGTLAIGAVAMSKKKVIVKRLNSIQNFGAMDMLCTDKTGTLTQDRVVLEKYCDVVCDEDPGVLELAYYNSFHQTGLKNLLDKAVLAHGMASNAKVTKVDEIPFDFSRRIMSVVVDIQPEGGGPGASQRRLISKGAPEGIFKRCSQVEVNGEVQELDPLILPDLQQELDKLQGQGFRVLAIAYKDVPKERSVYEKKDEEGLVLRGYVAFLDPPKESTREALAALEKHGVHVKVLTGDNDLVAKKICGDVGIPVGRVVLGQEVEAASEEQLDGIVETANLFARLSPSHKERVVRSLRRKGHVVGFLGDGINDAPALRAADVGISVDNAVDIAKESADLILLEKDLSVLEHGVVEGRRVFGNITKYIKMGTSSNFGNMFSVLGASAFLPFLPMLPIQLLTQNLLYDFSQLAIPFDRVEEYLLMPRQWRIDDIKRFMLFFGPVSSIFDYVTFGLLYFVLKADTPAQQSLFQSGWFVEGLLSQTLIVHMIRTRKIPFLQSNPALSLALATAAVMTVGVILPFTTFGRSLGMVALPLRFFGWLAGILVAYAALAQLVKSWYVRKYGYN